MHVSSFDLFFFVFVAALEAYWFYKGKKDAKADDERYNSLRTELEAFKSESRDTSTEISQRLEIVIELQAQTQTKEVTVTNPSDPNPT